MSIKIALAGNPNSGKTTLFNAITGSNQFVGNWPGVTVEKKEGRLKWNKDIIITDLPGIYSLSPYTLEEVVSRNYILNNKPDVILNIIDGTNLERNLYLTTQLAELGIPVLIAVNMMDIVDKNGDEINIKQLSKNTGCEVVEISALKGAGIKEAADRAVEIAKENKKTIPAHSFSKEVERVLGEISNRIGDSVEDSQKRFYAVKLFERDEKIRDTAKDLPDVEKIIEDTEEKMDDDSESIITNERYNYISSIIGDCLKKKRNNSLSLSDKIDRIVTNRFLALPIFAVVMFVVYYISITTVGGIATDWANDGVFGDGWHLFGIGTSAYEEAYDNYETSEQIVSSHNEGLSQAKILDEDGNITDTIDITPESAKEAESIAEAGEPDPANYGVWVKGIPVIIESGLDAVHCADWLKSLILDGIVAGVGAVLGFVPQMFILFMFLAILESCGYMARIAFIMDRIFRKFGLSGKSFIPMLIGTGCGVPGIMASRTIENDRDRKMTIMTTTFIPCGAKLPIIALIAGALFNGAWWVAPSAYFVGIAAIICSGIILKKTKMFAGEPAPFVMELPSYHLPTVTNVLRSMWERGWSFIKKAGSIILLSTIFIWFTSNFGFVDGHIRMLDDLSSGILASIGNVISPIFAPLGWGDWKSSVAAITGLVAKENVVGTLGILFGFADVSENGTQIWGTLANSYTAAAAYSFLVFNLLCAPCFAAMGAIKREMNNTKWFFFAVGYQTIFAYVVSLCVYQIGSLFAGGSFGIGTVVAILLIVFFIYMLVRPYKEPSRLKDMPIKV
ncbi:MAG: ferrous iron transport protein B [Clostridia bacterium]|jgi:ferrous iron transport protein B|nr:ferrous iron transport protein B [Clostridia bacterium]MCI2015473.1 ferrous iron transport protein B [Clostridia bacterium]